MRRPALALASAVFAVVLLAGCSGEAEEPVPEVPQDDPAQGDDVSQEWFEENCLLERATTTAENQFAIKQASLAPIPEGIPSDMGDLALHYFSYDESSKTMTEAGDLGIESPFCFRVDGGEAVTATVEGSDEETTFYPVQTPDAETTYVADMGLDLSTPNGLLFNYDNGTIGAGENLSALALSKYAVINDALLQDADDEKLDPATLEGAA